jgi:hypothetical protein
MFKKSFLLCFMQIFRFKNVKMTFSSGLSNWIKKRECVISL